MWSVCGTVGAIVAVPAVWVIYQIFFRESPTQRARAMSFTTSSLVEGAFPPNVELPPPIINSMLFFDECPDVATVEMNSNKFMKYKRSRCAVVKERGRWVFKEINYDSSNHIFTVEVNSEQELLSKADEICTKDLEGYGTRPMWCVYRLVNKGKGLSALVVRIHHVVGDGIALVESMNNTFVDENGAPIGMELPERARGDSKASIMTVLTRFVKAVIEVAMLANTPYDSDLVFTASPKKKLSSSLKNHKTIIMPSLRLDFVKDLKNKAHVTVNDIFMAAIAGTMRRYCEKKNDPLLVSGSNAKIQTRVLLPVAFPRPKEELGNSDRALRNKWYCFF